jgi:hypothetical protein
MARTLTAQIRDEIEAEERRISAREAKPAAPEPPCYSRPGADDLVPRTEGEREAESIPDPAAAGDTPSGPRPGP